MLKDFQIIARVRDQATLHPQVADRGLQFRLGSFQVRPRRGHIRLDPAHVRLHPRDVAGDLADPCLLLVLQADLRGLLFRAQLRRARGQLFLGHAQLLPDGLFRGLRVLHAILQLGNLALARAKILAHLLHARMHGEVAIG